MHLLDTNIFLEVLLEQDRANEVEQLMNQISEEIIHITELSFYSIGIHLNKKKKNDLFLKFVKDLFIDGKVKIISLNPTEMLKVITNIKSYNLDFDDAYQLTCANKYNLKLVSFDTDFDRTPAKRFEPKDLLK